MKPLVSKSILLSLVAAALVLLNSSRVFGYVNYVYPDSVTMSTAVGTTTVGYISISDGRDTTPPGQTKGTVHAYLTGSSEFTLMSDSIQQFVGYTYFQIKYAPTSTSPSYATLIIVGDSNTLYVHLVGNPIDHFTPELWTGDYDSLRVNQQLCQNFGLSNTNSDTVWVNSVTLSQSGSSWSLGTLPTFPFAIPGHASESIAQLCALWTQSDSAQLHGTLTVDYTFGSSSKSVAASLHGAHLPINAECVTVSNTNFGSVVEGGSNTQSITLTNTTDSTIYVDSVSMTGDASEFTINSPTFPLTIQSDSSVNVSITFSVPSPSTKDGYSAKLSAQIYGTSPDGISCNSLDAGLIGSVLIPIVDSITLDAPPGTETLSITAHTAKSKHAIFIHNTGTKNILLQYLEITDSSYAFFGTPGNESTSMYDTLNVGETSHPVIMTLEAPDTGNYNVDLSLYYVEQTANRGTVITGGTPYQYRVIAHRLPPAAAGVSEAIPQVAGFAISPNPAIGEVRISLPQDVTSTVEIYDILGNLMNRKQATGQYVWSGETPNGTAATGAYVVRVTEREANGVVAVSSKRLIFQR